MSISPEEDAMNLHRHENLKSFISVGQISLLQPYAQNQLIYQRTHLLAGIDLCGSKFCFKIKVSELGVVMGNYRMLSPQQNSANGTGDQEGMAQIRDVDTFHNSAHYRELISAVVLTDSGKKIGNKVYSRSVLTD